MYYKTATTEQQTLKAEEQEAKDEVAFLRWQATQVENNVGLIISSMDKLYGTSTK